MSVEAGAACAGARLCMAVQQLLLHIRHSRILYYSTLNEEN